MVILTFSEEPRELNIILKICQGQVVLLHYTRVSAPLKVDVLLAKLSHLLQVHPGEVIVPIEPHQDRLAIIPPQASLDTLRHVTHQHYLSWISSFPHNTQTILPG